MNKIVIHTIILAIVLSVSQCFSQSWNSNKQEAACKMLSGSYSFSYDTATYKDLVGGKNMSAGVVWDDHMFTCPIGFSFKFFNQPFDSVRVTDPYYIYFGTDVGMGYDYSITVFGADMVDRGFGVAPLVPKSPISYLLVGTTPNRILKVEWKNAAFLRENICYSTRTNYMNLQLWLFETSNIIEIHYGPNLVTYADSIYPRQIGPDISLTSYPDMKFVSLIGDSTKPTVSGFPEQNIIGTPPSGIIYRFSSGFVGIADQLSAQYSFYPNPVTNEVRIISPYESEWINIHVYNLLGSEIISKDFRGTNQIVLDVNNLPVGNYLLKLQNSATTITHKFTKQ